ncbi:efflux RND transporter periplasmic adaptor subunit [Flavobacterium sp. ANB]|uniref:efflux RND transporter periplasmic adaptor subunit n=1 Tax=unclassified Flavobacterium TaxID=196869 RepID=UPI0012B90A61|nr:MULTISPECIES: efflux RND transporter periplasmic adaptor subunit [unclassified Flavobacterium]MBF4518971.1 efflux RND transporter periplasmic adaptor subunit [Flavobacterium sp. ANB]MTD71580.1 efflux RND transporter periplasmic adaptor subunit [Flavobacterium sp. LC2016-13]
MFCKKSRRNIFVNIALSLVIPVILVALFSSCKKNHERTITQEKFPVINPVQIDTTYNKEYVAEIQSIQNVELRAKFKGFIDKIYVDEGQIVQADQTLFTLNNSEYKLELLKTQAQLKSIVSDLKSAEVQLKNTKTLVEKNIVSSSELVMAKSKIEALQANIDEANANIATAKLNLSFTNIKAPFSGVINRIPNKLGTLVEEGTLLTTISNNSAVFAYFNVSEKEFLDFKENNEANKNTSVSLLLANNKLLKQNGKIETILSELDGETGTIGFRARFSNPDNLLKHGSSAKIVLPVPLKNAILIPQKTTFEIQEKLYVFVVDANNKVAQREITISSRMPNLYVVASGLTVNDKIIYEGIQNVKSGMKIIPETKSFQEVIAILTNH